MFFLMSFVFFCDGGETAQQIYPDERKEKRGWWMLTAREGKIVQQQQQQRRRRWRRRLAVVSRSLARCRREINTSSLCFPSLLLELLLLFLLPLMLERDQPRRRRYPL